MNVFSFIKQAFSCDNIQIPSMITSESCVDVRAIVAKQAEGNLPLQLQQYLTQSQIDQKRHEVCHFTYHQ